LTSSREVLAALLDELEARRTGCGVMISRFLRKKVSKFTEITKRRQNLTEGREEDKTFKSIQTK
jgi:hypothetical protein